MKTWIRWIVPFLLVVGLLLCMVACRDTEQTPGGELPPDEEGENMNTMDLILNGEAQYVIVRPELGEQVLTSAAVMLNTALTQMGGLDKPYGLTTDYTDAVEKEILLGNTNRPESAEVLSRLGDDLYRAEWVNGKLVVVGVDDAATARGVRHLLREVLGYTGASSVQVREQVAVSDELCFTGVKGEMIAVDPRNPQDVVVYSADVLDYGAIGDGISDDTNAFQRAIDAVAAMGGGTVYAPAGNYVIKGNLTVKRSVYLLGEWYHPEAQPESMHKGTVLLATGNKGKADATPMITIGASAGVIGLTVYYPDQDVSAPVAYPAAFLIKDSVAGDGTQHAASIQNVTVVNGWRGIAADQGNQLPFIRDAYMSVLDYGFRINRCYDCARIVTMHISPAYWAAYEGIDEATVAAQTKKSAKGVILMRTDGQMMNDISVRSCYVGLSLERNTEDSGETAGYTNLSNVSLTDCTVGINHEYNSAAISMAEIRCSGAGAICVRTTDTTDDTGELRIYDCSFENPDGAALIIDYEAPALVAIQNSTFAVGSDYAVDAAGGVLSLTNNDFTGCAKAIRISSDVMAAIISNNRYDGELVNQLGDRAALVQTASFDKLPAATDFSQNIGEAPIVAATKQVFSVLDYGAKGDGTTDDTDAFVATISAAKRAGGGIVYLPAGYYNVRQGFTIPSGVELRGVHEGMHVTTGEGSVIYVTEDRGIEDGIAFVTMEARSGLRGITFWYPEQNWKEIAAYPWTIEVQGQDCVIRNICFGNAYRGMNMADADCGGHFVDGVTGCVLREGIALDGSSKAGVIMNTHFNATFYYAVWGTQLTDASGAFGAGEMAGALFANNNGQLTAYRFGETVDEEILFIFNYRARYGMDFTGGFDGKVVGSGVDGSLCGIRVTGRYDEPLALLNFMDDIVPGSTEEGNLGIYVNVDEGSTVHFVASGTSSYNYIPAGLVLLENGSLILEGFNAKVTPESGGGAIRVKNGDAELSGIVFNHVGRLDGNGQFTQQAKTTQTYDVRVDENGSLEMYSAIGRRFFGEKLEGYTGDYNYVVTQ